MDFSRNNVDTKITLLTKSNIAKRSRRSNKQIIEEKQNLEAKYADLVEAFTSLTKRYEANAEENHKLKKENEKLSEGIDNISGECSYLTSKNQELVLENISQQNIIQIKEQKIYQLENKVNSYPKYLELIDRSIVVANSAMALSVE